MAGVDHDAAGVVLDGAEQPGAQPRHVREQPLVRALAQGEVEPDLVVGYASPSPKRATPDGTSTARPAGPSGSPTSAEPTTSPASAPSPCPTWAPNIAPPSWRIIPIIGPAIAGHLGGHRS